jgi:hypothetical protein
MLDEIPNSDLLIAGLSFQHDNPIQQDDWPMGLSYGHQLQIH